MATLDDIIIVLDWLMATKTPTLQVDAAMKRLKAAASDQKKLVGSLVGSVQNNDVSDYFAKEKAKSEDPLKFLNPKE
jgi:hypothetical protein